MKKLSTRRLGVNGPEVSAIGLGTMGIGAHYGRTDESSAFDALTYAADRGMTFWDCADIYGSAELSLAKWFDQSGRRDEIFLATKFGAYDPEGKFGGGRQCSTPDYIKYALQRSLSRLGTTYIDLYYQHRVDPAVPIEVVMEALREPIERGQVRYIGLSECSLGVLRRAKAVKGVGEKLIACQMEFSPFELGIEKSGFVKVAEELGVSVVAYSPLGRGLVTGAFRSRADFEPGDLRLDLPRFTDENFPKNLVLTDKFKTLAQKMNSTPSQIALAWILAEYGNFVPIPGCRTVERVEENAGAAELQLTVDDVATIRSLVEEADVQGDRTAEKYKVFYQQDCIALEQWKGD